MSKYRVAVHYSFKQGMEDKGVKIIEQDIFDLLLKNGCVAVESFQHEDNRSKYFYLASWNSLEDARKVQKQWEEKEKPILDLCTNAPKREIFSLKTSRKV